MKLGAGFRRAVMVWVVLVLGVQGMSIPGAWARSNAEIQEMIDQMLMERHPTDRPEWWRGLGPNAPSVIISMYENSSHTYRRLRLLQGLGWFDTPEAAEFLKKQAENSRDDVIRNTAIRSVGFSQGAKETDFIARFLESSDPQTRYAAAETLKRFNDPKANEILEGYLKKEKLPWIGQKLKGELPRPTGMLTPVATSEDRLAPEFAGEWQGFWISPKGPREKGMESRPVRLQLKAEGPVGLKGEMEVKKKGRWKLERAFGKATHIRGVFTAVATEPRPSPSPAVKAEELGFEADLLQQAGSILLEVKLQKSGGFLILRRDPPSVE